MAKPGRKTKDDLAHPTVYPMREPPAELVGEQRDVWRSIMLDVPQERMTAENVAIIIQLCRHTVTARIIASIVNALEADGKPPIKAYQEALKMRERETKIISSLAQRLRIGIEGYNRASQKKARRAAIEALPWHEDD